MLLTDEEITLIVRECARGSAINRDGSTSHRIAKAIESAVLAKLREQEPVAWMSPRKERIEFSRKDTVYGSHTIPLYLHPAPIPEGMVLVPIEKLSAFLSSVNGDCYMGQTWEATEVYQFRAMLVVARSGKCQ